jgi:hypothetical protein
VDYCRLDAATPAVLRVRGPRRLKIVSRYLYAADEPDSTSFTLGVAVDERRVLTRVRRELPDPVSSPCEEAGRVGRLRRTYLEIPGGWHDVNVTAEAPGGGVPIARFLLEIRRSEAAWTTYAPDRFLALAHLQFESGNRSAYYLLDASSPLSCRLSGPTTLEVWSRLDFDHAMNGVQPYVLEVRLDGEHWQTRHFDTEKLDAAVWVERDDVMPGKRRRFRLAVPAGAHRVELRCPRPRQGTVAVKLRIPERDIR